MNSASSYTSKAGVSRIPSKGLQKSGSFIPFIQMVNAVPSSSGTNNDSLPTSSSPRPPSFLPSTSSNNLTPMPLPNNQNKNANGINNHSNSRNNKSFRRFRRRTGTPKRQLICAPPWLWVLTSFLALMLLLLPLSNAANNNNTNNNDTIETTTTVVTLATPSPTTSPLPLPSTTTEGANAPVNYIANSTTRNETETTIRLLSSAAVGIPTSDISSSSTSSLDAQNILNPNGTATTTTIRHFQLISFNWSHVQAPFTLSLWLLFASVAKILFNLDKRLPEAIPDSALLIVLGLVVGTLLRLLDVDSHVFTLPSSTFFLYLLPPIIFDAGYFMPNRQLFDNLDSVLLFAFCGTIWNTLAIGYSLLWLAQFCLFSVPFSAFQILLFASLISAVDPVAVIAVFEEVHINEFLFINVFGEALFNDGVSVVLYQMFRKFILIGEANLRPTDFIAGIGSFLVIALGGIAIGLAFALLASLATKYTIQVRILAPVFIFVVPYISYLTAEMFGLSSILAIVACGIGMKQYVKGNLSQDAYSSVKYFVKMLAQSSETVIFMFLGLSTVSREQHHLDWAFVGATIGLCLLHRVIGVVVQCAILNRFRTKKFSFSDQFVLSYGGLRGAIAFGLVVSLDDDLPAKQMFVSTCIAVIFFTVFVQGITIRPLLYWLKVEKKDKDHQETMIEKIYTRYCDYMMAGLEDIAGQKGKNSFRDGFERFNAKVMKPILMRDERQETFDTSSILRAYRKITLLEAHHLARASIRKRPKGGRRVGPAHSPSSVSSSLTYSNCWTTTTTATMMNGGGGGGGNRDSSRSHFGGGGDGGADSPMCRKSSAEERPPSSAHSTQNSGEERAAALNQGELEQYLTQPENAEILYAMFSRLLDRKIVELGLRKDGATAAIAGEEDDDVEDPDAEFDIKDNYFDAFKCSKGGRGRRPAGRSRTTIEVGGDGHVADFLSPPPPVPFSIRHGSREKRWRKLSMSAAIERQIGTAASVILRPENVISGTVAARHQRHSAETPPSFSALAFPPPPPTVVVVGPPSHRIHWRDQQEIVQQPQRRPRSDDVTERRRTDIP